MINFISENLIHFYLGGLWLVFFGCIEGARRTYWRELLAAKGLRKDRIARGVK